MTPSNLLRNTVLGARNLVRSLRRSGLDGIVLPIQGSYPELSPQREALPFPCNRLLRLPTQANLADMRTVMEMIGGDARVRTLVLRFDTLQAGLSTLYSLRRMFLDLRAKGKHLIAWLPSATTLDYYLASACDEIIMPQSAQLYVLGIQTEPMFFKDTLAMIGIKADFESVGEYKVAPDTFRRSTMSEPNREMIEAVIDSFFDQIVSAIAEGRKIETAQVRELIDGMPLTASQAVDIGLIDAVLYEDELTAHLPRPDRTRQKGDGSQAALLAWHQAVRWLRVPLRQTTRQRIGVVSLQGMIVPGRSRRLPVPIPIPVPFSAGQAGAETIVQTLRLAQADKNIAAVILHVDSPGGSMVASDLIWREVQRLQRHKPVVALMGGQAASGGYYVSAPANHIVARPATLTGSIGIWGGKLAFTGLYDRLSVGREAIRRGAMAGLFSDSAPFTDEERDRIRWSLGEGYALFKARVAQGRDMTDQQVEEIARGRVWTGAQAREIGLVDELGDFDSALTMAKELSGLDPKREYTVVQLHPTRRFQLPPPYLSAEETEANSLLKALLDTLPGLTHERLWALAPWTIRVLA